MAKQGARGASSVLDSLNSGDELSIDNNESDECDITEERIEHGGQFVKHAWLNFNLVY